MKYIIMLGILAIALTWNQALSAMDWDQWYQERTSEYEASVGKPIEERIPILGQMLRINSGYRPPSLEGVRLKSYLRAQQDLLRIPGHSEYYGNRIRDTYAAYKGTVLGERTDGNVGTLSREMDWGFKTMQQLPSPETVKVFGEMLSENWEAPPHPNPENIRPPSLGACAVSPMSKLPWIDPPTPPFEYSKGKAMLSTWQRWYAEVKSGQRSFAFIGQPVSYRFKPDGTVTTETRDASADPPLFPPAKEKENPVSSPAKEEPAATRHNIRIIGGLSALVLSLIAFFLRKRASASEHRLT